MMKHLVLAKFKPEVTVEQKAAMLPDIRRIFEGTLSVDGITDVQFYVNCVDRSNRYDLMIEITMDRSALEAYDVCAPHREWLDRYGDKLETKAIFDHEA